VHPTLGWHTPSEVNARYQGVFEASPIAKTEIAHLDRLWLLRHSVAHNGGLITHHDAYRMGAPHLGGESAKIDAAYIAAAEALLGDIVKRLAAPVGEKIIEKWLNERSTGTWAADQQAYSKLKVLTTAVMSRSAELPITSEADWHADNAKFGV